MTHPWLTALPYHLAIDLLRTPDRLPLGRLQHTAAVALVTQLSGLRNLTEALDARGPTGSEECSRLLSGIFNTLLTLVPRYGGSIGWFTGEALLVLFPHTVPNRPATVRRALQCALEMHMQLRVYSDLLILRDTPITMQSGLGLGRVLTTTVGDPQTRLIPLLAGSAIERAQQAAQYAGSDAVVIDDTIVPIAGGITATTVAPGFSHLKRLYAPASATPLLPLASPPSSLLPTLAAYLPTEIAQRIAGEPHALVEGYHGVNVACVRFLGLDGQDADTIARLQTYLAQVVQIIQRAEGYLWQIEIDDQGGQFHVLFGAPHSQIDAADRALRCALELRERSVALGVRTRIGIASGRTFCYLVESSFHRSYIVLGKAVHTALQLMQAAKADQILVPQATRGEVTVSVAWAELPPLAHTDRSQLVPVAALERRVQRVGGRLRAPGYTLPMVGRQAELALGDQLLEQTIRGHGQILSITAEAGMGKSRLIAELMRHSMALSVSHCASECFSHATNTSYLVWQGILRALFELMPGMDQLSCEEQVREQLAALEPQLLGHLPLFNGVLGTSFPETDITRSLDAKLRKSALEHLVLVCLRHWTARCPRLLILEDCHWIDELSNDLLMAVAEQLNELALLVIISYRPIVAGQPLTDPIRRMRSLPYFHELQLSEFTAAEAEQLIALKLKQLFEDQEQPPPALVTRLYDNAHGNPFYIDELVNWLHDRKIDTRDTAALMQLELPNTLQRLIQSRIEQLPEGPKQVLKVASVIGRLFKAHWLWAIAPQLGSAPQVGAHLLRLQQRELTQLERTEPELEYLFKHLTTREVAYTSLSPSMRSRLHERVGQYIEQCYAHELDLHLDLLAHHYGQSANADKQREYYWRAGQTAKAAFANSVAIDYFERLLPLLEEKERGPVLLALAEVEELLWCWNEAALHARTALELADRLGDQRLRAQAAQTYGMVLRTAGQYEQALSLLEQAREQFTVLGDQKSLVEICTKVAAVEFQRGGYDRVVAESELCLQLGMPIGEYLSCCHAYNSLGIVAGERGRYQESKEYLERGLALAEKHQLLHTQAVMGLIGNLGVTYAHLHDHGKSYAMQRRKLELVIPLGMQEEIVLTLGNIGASYGQAGYDDYSRRCYEACLARMQNLLEPRQVGWLMQNLAGVVSRLGDDQLAEALFARAVAVCRAFAIRFWLVGSLYTWASFETRQKRYIEAQQHNDEVYALASSQQMLQMQFLSSVLALRLQFLLGQLDLSAALARLDHLRTEWTEPEQQALLNYTAWQLDSQQELARSTAAELYRTLYAESPMVEYRDRYRELTGEVLSTSITLPEPPAIVQQHSLDLPAFLQRVDALLAESANALPKRE